MRATILLLMMLSSTGALDCQSVRVEQELRPFRINKLIVMDLGGVDDVRVEITGQTVHNQEYLLFSATKGAASRQLECFLYIDDSVMAVRVTISSPAAQTSTFDISTRMNPYRITVFSETLWMGPRLSGYRFTSDPGSLRPGDVAVLGVSPGQGATELGAYLERGIHVITDRAATRFEEPRDREDLWRGEIVVLDRLDSTTVREALEVRRGAFAAFKKRFYDLTGSAGFYGVPAPRSGKLAFRSARKEDIAAALEHHFLPDRIGGFHRILLLAFFLAGVLGVFFLRNSAALVIFLAGFLCVFVLLTFLAPDPAISLRLSLNPAHLEDSEIRLVRTFGPDPAPPSFGRVPSAGKRSQSFAPPDFEAGRWSLNFGLIRSANGELPLSAFATAASVKFDQFPLIERVGDRYVLKYENPLRYWSLHEPD